LEGEKLLDCGAIYTFLGKHHAFHSATDDLMLLFRFEKGIF